MNYIELSVFIAYFVFMVAIGLYFFSKSKGAGEKDYFLGGRNMGAWVSALSAGASDMSAWVLMGLPASIYLSGMGQTWIAIGLGIGYAVSWIFMAPRLRRFSIAAGDSITIPQYLTNRFLSKNKSLQILSAIIFLVAYTIYAASSIKACGTLFNTVMDIDPTVAMYIAAFIIVAYTFLGGFSAVCWTDFFQGMIMLAALLIAPLFALALAKAGDGAATGAALPDGFFKGSALRSERQVKNAADSPEIFVKLSGGIFQQGSILPSQLLRPHHVSPKDMRDGRSVFHDADRPQGRLMEHRRAFLRKICIHGWNITQAGGHFSLNFYQGLNRLAPEFSMASMHGLDFG